MMYVICEKVVSTRFGSEIKTLRTEFTVERFLSDVDAVNRMGRHLSHYQHEDDWQVIHTVEKAISGKDVITQLLVDRKHVSDDEEGQFCTHKLYTLVEEVS